MTDSAPESLVVLLGAPPMPGELIASYLRYRLPKVAIRVCASCADLKPGAASARGFVLIETSARNAPSISEAIARVRSDYPQAPILIASASPDAGSAAQAMRRGAQGFIAHLTPLSGLVDALQTVLDGGTSFPRLVAAAPSGGEGAAPPTREPSSSPRSALRLADRDAPIQPTASVELALMGADALRPAETAYKGSCRRRNSGPEWTGPERRRVGVQRIR